MPTIRPWRNGRRSRLVSGLRVLQLDAVITQSYVDHFDGLIDLDPFFDDGYPRPVDDAALHLDLVLDDELWHVKDHALRAQQTQTDVVIEMLGADLWKDFNIVEAFVAHHY